MTAGEFGLWQAFLEAEELGAAAEPQRWAELMAATLNGPLTKKSKQLWTAAEFLPRPWAPPPAPPKPASGADALRHIEAQKRARAEASASKG